jgi:hypothetical protein
VVTTYGTEFAGPAIIISIGYPGITRGTLAAPSGVLSF